MALSSFVRSPSRRCRIFLLGVMACGVTSAIFVVPYVSARPQSPAPRDHTVALLVATLMNKMHLSEMHIDDEISRRSMDLFFKALDPRKRYFYQSDIDEFASEREKIDDYIVQGDVRIAKRIFDRFLLRLDERTTVAQRWIDAEHDFSLDEEVVSDIDAMTYATSPAEADERWRKEVKLALLSLTADGTEYDEAVEKLHKRYRSARKYLLQTSNDDLLEKFLSSVTMSFDPHSSYMSKTTLEDFTIMMSLKLDGIGASLQSEYGETIVRRIIPGGAADKDGRLQVDDVITGVAQGDDGEMVDIVDMQIKHVVQLIRGKPGTVVQLEVIPADGSGRKIYDITRAHIELKDSEARSQVIELSPDGRYLDEEDKATDDKTAGDDKQPLASQSDEGKAYRIGIISLPSFYMDMDARRKKDPNFKSTSRDVQRLLQEFNNQNVDLVIMDLRFNGGGSLPESVLTTGLFIDKGPVVQVKGPDGRVRPLLDEAEGVVWSGPLIVVINKFSASASEIFAGAIQDYGRGIVVGDRTTHGKGTVQQLFDLGEKLVPYHEPPKLGALKMTIQQFYRPGGDSTQNRGVVSDVEIPWLTSHLGYGEADLDYAIDFNRVLPQRHINYPDASPQTIQELQQRSTQRCNESDFFALEKKKIERYKINKERSTITLNREKFLAERAELNLEKEQKKIADETQDEDRPVFAPTPYNQEVVAIAVDYITLQNRKQVAAAK